MPESVVRALIGAGSLIVLLLCWEGLGRSGWIDARLSSRPSLIARASYDLLGEGEFWRHVRVSGVEFMVGFALSCAIGIPLGLAMGWFRRVRLLLEPTMMAFYSVPRTTFLPLTILWFGIGFEMYVVIVFLGAFFPVLVNTITGVEQVDPVLVRAARSFGATEGGVFRHVLLPASLPFMMGGVRLGLGRALIGVIVGEMYVSIAGVGHLIMKYQAGLNTDKLMVLVCLVAFGGVTIVSLARRLESWLGPWRLEREVS
jgi:NitT/TauT family transport system permease protein